MILFSLFSVACRCVNIIGNEVMEIGNFVNALGCQSSTKCEYTALQDFAVFDCALESMLTTGGIACDSSGHVTYINLSRRSLNGSFVGANLPFLKTRTSCFCCLFDSGESVHC